MTVVLELILILCAALTSAKIIRASNCLTTRYPPSAAWIKPSRQTTLIIKQTGCSSCWSRRSKFSFFSSTRDCSNRTATSSCRNQRIPHYLATAELISLSFCLFMLFPSTLWPLHSVCMALGCMYQYLWLTNCCQFPLSSWMCLAIPIIKGWKSLPHQ